MKILGIKLTHDSAITLFDGDELVFSVELEKVKNNPRYAKFKSTAEIDRILCGFGYAIEEIDSIVIDGWKGGWVKQFGLSVSQYHEFYNGIENNIFSQDTFITDGYFGEYSSYPHMLCHIIGAYSASPFSKKLLECAVVNWDGGQNCRVHIVDPNKMSVKFEGHIHRMHSTIYSAMGNYFGPYVDKNPEKNLKGKYDWPGKIMGYISTGEYSNDLQYEIDKLYDKHFTFDPTEYELESCVRESDFLFDISNIKLINKYSHSDILFNIHQFIERKIIIGIQKLIPRNIPVIFTGGSALNIKWNNAIRKCGYDIWVPPFPNDCGNSFGAACCELAFKHNKWSVSWDVYSGPEIIDNYYLLYQWKTIPCDTNQLANFFAQNPNAPVVVLNGKAEIGPRALGHRSIICAAVNSDNKMKINKIKKREIFRPISPICIEEYSKKIFSPGGHDPHMLFEHHVNDKWSKIIPAVVHLDATARLQTVSTNDSKFVYDLLKEYDRLTGIPVLCNTSANYNGSGFFPDVVSASKLDGIDYIWCNGKLSTRNKK